MAVTWLPFPAGHFVVWRRTNEIVEVVALARRNTGVKIRSKVHGVVVVSSRALDRLT